MHPNEALIEKFYQSFDRKDHPGMMACYHAEVEFSDPVFQALEAGQARAMWQMFIERGKDLKMNYSQVKAEDQHGSANWDAFYTFSGTGRPVHNAITSIFTFKDGLIIGHHDRFDLWKWAGMALGLKGRLLGWSPPVQSAIRRQARATLEQYMAKSKTQL